MTHDYGERMSLALDGRLSAQERADLTAHLATCDECRARWAAFQQVDRVLSSASQVMPAPGFAAHFAARLAQQQILLAQRALAGVGAFAAGAIALALLIVPIVLGAWTSIAGLVTGAPTLLANMVEVTARWWVTFSALGEAGRSILDVLGPSSGPIVMGYALMLTVIVAAWASVMRELAGRRKAMTLPALVWL